MGFPKTSHPVCFTGIKIHMGYSFQQGHLDGAESVFLYPFIQRHSSSTVALEEVKIACSADVFLVPLKRVTLAKCCTALAYISLVVSRAPENVDPRALYGQCSPCSSPGIIFLAVSVQQ